MKLNKSLLQAMLVGVTLGTAAGSCNLIEELEDKDLRGSIKETIEECQLPPANVNNPVRPGDNCPACGMG